MGGLLHWGPISTLGIIATVTGTATFSSLRLVAALRPEDRPVEWVKLVLFILWVMGILYFFRRAVSLGPGRPRRRRRADGAEARTGVGLYCDECERVVPPRAHHCRVCNACSLKMDHHCPWINTCVGAWNQGHFLAFLLTAPLGCIRAGWILLVYLSFRWAERVHTGPKPSDYAALFGLGLAIGVTLAVGGLAVVQLLAIGRNQTDLERWVDAQAHKRPRDSPFVYPYHLGFWGNLVEFWRQCADPDFDGVRWTVASGCSNEAMGEEEAAQRQWRRASASVRVVVQRQPSTALVAGLRATVCAPGLGEIKIDPKIGEHVRVFGVAHGWGYGEVVTPLDGGGWTIVRPVVKGYLLVDGYTAALTKTPPARRKVE